MTKKKPSVLTLGEIEEFEDTLDIAWEDAYRSRIRENGKVEQVMTTKALVGMVWLIRKRENPDFTIDDARALPVDELAETLGGEIEEAPLDNPDETATAE